LIDIRLLGTFFFTGLVTAWPRPCLKMWLFYAICLPPKVDN